MKDIAEQQVKVCFCFILCIAMPQCALMSYFSSHVLLTLTGPFFVLFCSSLMDGLFLRNTLNPDHHRRKQGWIRSPSSHGELHQVPGVHSRWSDIVRAPPCPSPRARSGSWGMILCGVSQVWNAFVVPIFLPCWGWSLARVHVFHMNWLLW